MHTVTKLESPEFTEGTLTSFFTADKMETVDLSRIKFTNPKLIRYKEGTKEVLSIMTADIAIAEMKHPGRLSMEYKSMQWKGNFKYHKYGEEDDGILTGQPGTRDSGE